MNDSIVFCDNRKCKKEECKRHYRGAPFNIILRWKKFNKEMKEQGKDFLGGEK